MAKKKTQRQLKTEIHNAVIMDHLANMSKSETKLYVTLRMFSNWTTGWCCPSQVQITKQSGLGRKAIQNARESLKNRGILIYEVRKPRNRKGREYGRKRYFYKVHPTNEDFILPLDKGRLP